jgi:ABC-type antimicrobial peptide transport system permease subunit
VLWNIVDGDFFDATGLQIVQGRSLRHQNGAAPAIEIVLNERAAHYFFGDRSPVGQTVTIPPTSVATIVGVVSDAKYRTVREDMPRTIYTSSDLHAGHVVGAERTIYVRGQGSPSTYVAALRAAVRDVDPQVPLYDVKTLAERKRDSLVKERLLAVLTTTSSLVALCLAAIGLYGIVAFSLEQRLVEIGIRISLGAGRGRLVLMVLRETLATITIGLSVGLALCFLLSRWLAGQLYGINGSDPGTLAGACSLLTIVAVVAACLPVVRSSLADPIVALRS